MHKSARLVLMLVFLVGTGCSTPAGKTSSETGAVPTADNSAASINKDDYPVFPNADAGADPSIPSDQGGKGFKSEGWQTNTDFNLQGDPRAVKGGVFREFTASFPGTLRMFGPEANTIVNYLILYTMYESLVSMDYSTMNFIPALASHWQISADHGTMRFRINPNARWSDGEPVTSEDVIRTWVFMTDKGLQDPTSKALYDRFEKPVAESKYIVSVKAKEPSWRSFLDISSMLIFPAHVLKGVDGAAYLRDYNFKFLTGTGPYTVKEQGVEKGKSFTLTRRTDYWAQKARSNVGLYNFDQIKMIVVRDENLAFEMFKKGDLDFFYVNRSKQWVQDLNFENIQRGVIQKVKTYNSSPEGAYGIAFNMRREPFNDLRVRKALTLLLDRKKLIEKIMFNEYQPMTSYFPNSVYENHDNPTNEANPEEALKLLAEAGWNSRDSQGRLVKNGRPLELELQYDTPTFEPHLTVYQEDLRKVGISLNLRLVTGETQFSLLMNRNFGMALHAWSGLLFPNPEEEWKSSFADQPNSNNINGFKDKQVDDLIDKYNNEFDVQKRIQLVRQMDGIIARAYPYALFWESGFQRFLFWDKFGFPKGYISRTGDFLGAGTGAGVPQLWWYDPQKSAALNEAMSDKSRRLPAIPLEDRYWLEYGKAEDLTRSEPQKTQ